MNRVLIVDDTPDVRLLLRVVLETTDAYEVVDEAKDGREAIALATLHQPDVIVMDQMMPSMSGTEAVPRLREAVPGVAIVMFSAVSAAVMAEHAPAVEAIVGKGDVDALVEKLDEIFTRRATSAD